MTREIEVPNLDDLVKLYEGGTRLVDVASMAGLSPTGMARKIVAAGAARRDRR